MNASTAERDALEKAFARLSAELQRVESRYQRLESQVHDLAIGYAMNSQAAMQLTIDAVRRLETLEARFDIAGRRPPRSRARSQRGASMRRKVA
ncbi:MAG TPA: hypothetical protein VNO30_06080 [Kofleriaceae bacterium]|nr:hypothetical protein [Kofleriaceae bacterium]